MFIAKLETKAGDCVFRKWYTKANDFIKSGLNRVPTTESVSLTEKYCPDCGGGGDVFLGSGECETCHGTGIVKKTYQEYVDSLD